MALDNPRLLELFDPKVQSSWRYLKGATYLQQAEISIIGES
jgi:hypothetical protein